MRKIEKCGSREWKMEKSGKKKKKRQVESEAVGIRRR